MIRTAVESSNVKEIAWEANCLFVTFKGKKPTDPERTWQYTGCPIEKYNDMAEAQSPGGYLRSEIIPFYNGTEVPASMVTP